MSLQAETIVNTSKQVYVPQNNEAFYIKQKKHVIKKTSKKKKSHHDLVQSKIPPVLGIP